MNAPLRFTGDAGQEFSALDWAIATADACIEAREEFEDAAAREWEARLANLQRAQHHAMHEQGGALLRTSHVAEDRRCVEVWRVDGHHLAAIYTEDGVVVLPASMPA